MRLIHPHSDTFRVFLYCFHSPSLFSSIGASVFISCSASATFGTRPAMKYIAARNKTSTFLCLRLTGERRKPTVKICATSQSSFSTTNTSSTTHFVFVSVSFAFMSAFCSASRLCI